MAKRDDDTNYEELPPNDYDPPPGTQNRFRKIFERRDGRIPSEELNADAQSGSEYVSDEFDPNEIGGVHLGPQEEYSTGRTEYISPQEELENLRAENEELKGKLAASQKAPKRNNRWSTALAAGSFVAGGVAGGYVGRVIGDSPAHTQPMESSKLTHGGMPFDPPASALQQLLTSEELMKLATKADKPRPYDHHIRMAPDRYAYAAKNAFLVDIVHKHSPDPKNLLENDRTFTAQTVKALTDAETALTQNPKAKDGLVQLQKAVDLLINHRNALMEELGVPPERMDYALSHKFAMLTANLDFTVQSLQQDPLRGQTNPKGGGYPR